ncbi:Uncharacterised protein [Streptococcus pneumoniae]|nr:Uncharacterised protein [Streptococcus pneumoniae]
MKRYLVKWHDYDNNEYEDVFNEDEIDYACEVLAHMIDSITEVN